MRLGEELNHIQTYLEIQKERFEFLTVYLQFSWEEAHQVQTLRLTLQPLVENVFRHAYEKHERYPEYIAILGEKTEAGYRLVIVDKGGGMEYSMMEKLNRAFHSAGETEHHWLGEVADKEKESGKVGIWNVHQRLRLRFGEPYGLNILESTERGTRIEVHLPLMNGGA